LRRKGQTVKRSEKVEGIRRQIPQLKKKPAYAGKKKRQPEDCVHLTVGRFDQTGKKREGFVRKKESKGGRETGRAKLPRFFANEKNQGG